MLLFEWNSLRVGDAVMVHDDADLDAAMRSGVVRIVQTGRGTGNDVAVRLDGGAMVSPRRAAVHLASSSADDCWRCDMFAARHQPSVRAGAA